MSQAEVSANLDYLIQTGWVREVTKKRTFKTRRGMEVGAEQIKYKISDAGIGRLEAGTAFRKTHAVGQVNITNIKGVTILGDGNVVNADFTDLSRAIEDLDRAIADCQQISDEQKLEATADLATLRAQIAKKNPDRSVIARAWSGLQALATVDGVIGAWQRVASFLAGLFIAGDGP